MKLCESVFSFSAKHGRNTLPTYLGCNTLRKLFPLALSIYVCHVYTNCACDMEYQLLLSLCALYVLAFYSAFYWFYVFYFTALHVCLFTCDIPMPFLFAYNTILCCHWCCLVCYCRIMVAIYSIYYYFCLSILSLNWMLSTSTTDIPFIYTL